MLAAMRPGLLVCLLAGVFLHCVLLMATSCVGARSSLVLRAALLVAGCARPLLTSARLNNSILVTVHIPANGSTCFGDLVYQINWGTSASYNTFTVSTTNVNRHS
jgi:hypothetical protein